MTQRESLPDLSERERVVADLLAERIVPYDAWWYDSPEAIAKEIVAVLDSLTSDEKDAS